MYGNLRQFMTEFDMIQIDFWGDARRPWSGNVWLLAAMFGYFQKYAASCSTVRLFSAMYGFLRQFVAPRASVVQFAVITTKPGETVLWDNEYSLSSHKARGCHTREGVHCRYQMQLVAYTIRCKSQPEWFIFFSIFIFVKSIKLIKNCYENELNWKNM